MEKPSRRILRQFVAGQLSEEEAERIIAYLTESEETLVEVDTMWAEQSRLGVNGEQLPDLDVEKGRTIEQRLFRRINRSNLGNKVTVFGIVGFLQVIEALLSPLFQAGRTPATRQPEE